MISKYNHLTIWGNIGKDPEVRATQTGKEITSFSLAVWQGKDRATMWLDCKSFDPITFGKGAKVVVEGKLMMEAWTSKEGDPVKRFVVIVSCISQQPPREEEF
jgi:single-strand DNA-binding protein